MSDALTTQNKLIQQEFTKQAQAYASNPTISDPDWAQRLLAAVQAVRPALEDARVLEVATGPGYVAMTFARVAREVVGIDLTDAPLAIAEAGRQERGLENVRFQTGDAYILPFDDAVFDVAVCRLAFHHFADAARVLAEMTRVCRSGGVVAVEDLTASDDAEKAAYYNHWEQLRDPSHTMALSIGQLVTMFGEAGLEIEHIQMEKRRQVVEQWMRNSQTPAATAQEIRRLLADDRAQQLSNTHIYDNEEGALCFDHRMITLVGVKD